MNKINFDVVVIGGGISGTAAGIQSARLGAKTLIIEETPWLGGMVTSAGVSAFDGNKYAVGGGIFGEYRKLIEDYYGGPENTYTGWISLTCFEPKVGKNLIHQLAFKEENLTIWFESKLVKILKNNNKVTGAIISNKAGESFEVEGNIFIEATEFGDVLAAADVPYRLGRDSKQDTGEKDAPDKWDEEIQDMTFCATLQKYEGKAPEVKINTEYDPESFINSTAIHSNLKSEKEAGHTLHSWDGFVTYALLPNNKYLLNWPFRANDFFPTPLEMYEKPETREKYYQQAKEHTLNYLHYIQNTLGHPEWGLAEDEFPTKDKLPFIPYIRESRRVKGKYLMVEKDVVAAENSYRPPFCKSSIAVGDYFLDHHHSSFFIRPENPLIENLPENAPFQIPYESLIPEKTKGLLVAEKSISVSHIVNGCTRLQPVVMLIGQAAGAAAALCSSKNIQPDELDINELQETLLNAGCQLFPYKDLYNSNPYFKEIQRLALDGVYPDEKDFVFNPDKIVDEEEMKSLKEIIKKSHLSEKNIIGKTRQEVYSLLYYKLEEA